MQTDIPLKRLTAICAADLLPLLGAAGMEVVGVEILELPSLTTALDTVLRLRDRRGWEHLHLVEEKLAELVRVRARERVAMAAERATSERQQLSLEQSFTRIVKEAVVARFPSTPAVLVSAIRRIRDTARLEKLLQAVLDAPDQARVEQLLRNAADAAR